MERENEQVPGSFGEGRMREDGANPNESGVWVGGIGDGDLAVLKEQGPDQGGL